MVVVRIVTDVSTHKGSQSSSLISVCTRAVCGHGSLVLLLFIISVNYFELTIARKFLLLSLLSALKQAESIDVAMSSLPYTQCGRISQGSKKKEEKQDDC